MMKDTMQHMFRIHKNALRPEHPDVLTPEQLYILLLIQLQEYKNKKNNVNRLFWLPTELHFITAKKTLVNNGWIKGDGKGRYYCVYPKPDINYVDINLKAFSKLLGYGFNPQEIMLFFIIMTFHGYRGDNNVTFTKISKHIGMTRREITSTRRDFEDLLLKEKVYKEQREGTLKKKTSK